MLTLILIAAGSLAGSTSPSNGVAAEGQPSTAPVVEVRPDIPQIDAYEARQIAGFRVLVHRDLVATGGIDGPRVIAALTWDLELFVRLVPEDASAMLKRTTPIWVTPDLPSAGGWDARGLCHHPSRDWLVDAGYGADRAGAVEVCNVGEYLLWRAEQPLCVLHEMAHALQYELGDPAPILETFEAARSGGAYERVPFALLPAGQTRRAYALNNHIEYFAEVSEAYFGRNDYFPFTRADLERVDPGAVRLVRAVWSMPRPEAPASDASPGSGGP